MRSLKESISGMVDLGVVLMIGVAFVGLMVVAYIIYALKTQLNPTGAALNTITNITKGFDNAIALILVAITIWILAIAISALLILRGRQE
jgi:type II secretory pathway component PulF